MRHVQGSSILSSLPSRWAGVSAWPPSTASSVHTGAPSRSKAHREPARLSKFGCRVHARPRGRPRPPGEPRIETYPLLPQRKIPSSFTILHEYDVYGIHGLCWCILFVRLRGSLQKLADLCRFFGFALLLGSAAGVLCAASNSTLSGRVIDPSGRPVPGAEIMVRNSATLVKRTVSTNHDGVYEFPALAVGTYRMEVQARGFRTYIVDAIDADVARTVVQEVRLEIGDLSQEVTVESQAGLIDAATSSVGHVINGSTVQEIPLNGR